MAQFHELEQGLPLGTAVKGELVTIGGNASILPGANSKKVTFNAPATVGDLTIYSTVGSVTILDINAAFNSIGVNQVGTPLGELVTWGIRL